MIRPPGPHAMLKLVELANRAAAARANRLGGAETELSEGSSRAFHPRRLPSCAYFSLVSSSNFLTLAHPYIFTPVIPFIPEASSATPIDYHQIFARLSTTMFAKYALPVVAAAAGAQAASCSVSATTTISTGATGLSSCSTFTGSIAIATDATTVSLDGVQKIDGDLIATNATALTSLSADSLEEVDTFHLDQLTVLGSLTFPKLTKVGAIEWSSLPALSELSFTSGVKEADTVNIQNTFLSSLDGIALKEVSTFFIANNKYLKDITVQFTSIKDALTLSANADDLQASFPNLEWAYNMTFRNVSTISTPSLASLNGSLGFYGDSIKSYEAANLTTVGGSLSFVGNGQLTNISLDALEKVSGGFQIADNPKLHNASFPALETVGGALDFSGNLTDVSLESLKDVRGAFNIQSESNIDDVCTHFKSLSGNSNVIKGKFQCAGSQSNPGGADTTPTGSSSSSKSTSTGAAGHLDVTNAAGLGAAGVLAAMLGFF
ncbi:Protein ecm33 [Lasiodiplodia hormozganensis]|uniref:Protein ecm33 n=1 Tax=Lasiodiplodia hormozganensis TaxID=869390 RepID=A0AA39YK14_9PEZI|nr:Protein ecm33 [Lasiodiplodia hormozganensis]